MQNEQIKDIPTDEHVDNIRAYSEAILNGLQKVVEGDDNRLDLNALLFACASIQALFINRVQDEGARHMMLFEAARMLHFSIKSQRQSGIFDFSTPSEAA